MRHTTFGLALLALFVLSVAQCQTHSNKGGWATEYQAFHKPHGYTSFGLGVVFPEWLAEEDRPQVLRLIEAYVGTIDAAYQHKTWVPWEEYTLMLHPAIDHCVDCPRQSGIYNKGFKPEWVHGFIHDKTIVVTWSPFRDALGNICGISERDALGVFPHELFHVIFRVQYGDPDAQHTRFFVLPEVQVAIAAAKASAPPIVFSQATQEALARYTYVPWAWPEQ